MRTRGAGLIAVIMTKEISSFSAHRTCSKIRCVEHESWFRDSAKLVISLLLALVNVFDISLKRSV